jgi:dolichyl-phosphate beta-glucosyltransferase
VKRVSYEPGSEFVHPGSRRLGACQNNALRRLTINETPLLSIVIPAHNEERRLPGSLDKITAFLATQTYSYEVLIIENGSTDDTVGVARWYGERFPYVRFYQETARGKGLAVRRGMLEARGRYRFICDADLSMPIEEINKFLPPALEDYDVAIASREAPGAVRYDEPWYRHVIGRIFNLLIRWIAVRGFEDTQCGFKCFRDEVAEDLFIVQTLDGIGFDVELLFVAQKRGYEIIEVPIHWTYSAESRMRLVRDSLRAIGELILIRRNWRQGIYARRSQ